MDPITWAAIIGAVVNIATAPKPQAAPAVSSASQNSVFDASGWTVATSGSTASGGGASALWFAGGFLTVAILMKAAKK